MFQRTLWIAMLSLLSSASTHADPAENASAQPPIRIISSMATREILSDLSRRFEEQSPHRVVLESVGGVDAEQRVKNAENFDVVILASGAIDRLAAGAALEPGSALKFVHSSIAVAIRQGAQKIDIHSESALRQAVIAAKSISYSTGPSGVYLQNLFEKWGVAEALKQRTIVPKPGIPVATLVAGGEAEIGFQQLSELMHAKGISVIGPLPAEIQAVTTFSAAIPKNSAQKAAARDYMQFITSPAAYPVIQANGMKPAQ